MYIVNKKMKKIIIILSLLFFSFNSFSQSCEQREEKMLSLVGGFSAGLLYNTYGVIGAVADGFLKDAFESATVSDLMNAQKSMIDNIIKLIDGNLKGNTFIRENDKTYIQSLIDVLKGLRLQALLLIDIAETNSGKKKDEYEQQRQKNWSAISNLMGITE